MGVARVHQSNFNRGELDPKLVGRVSLTSYGNSLKKARNVIVTNQGAVERRPGTYFRADLGASTRLESFIFSGSQEYVFAFQNTPLQYTREIKKSAVDLAYNRGDIKTNISKIIYYGAAQNLIFGALQNALFTVAFDDDQEKFDTKTQRTLNGMFDTVLRGSGLPGAILATTKHFNEVS